MPAPSRYTGHLATAVGERVVGGLSRRIVDHVHNPGTPIWERDWDILLILDACRVDLMHEVVDHPVIGGGENVGTHWSPASKSSDWLRRTFTDEYREEIKRTAYISGNPFTAEASPDDDRGVMQEARRHGYTDLAQENIQRTGRPNVAVEPGVLDEVWTTDWDNDLNTVPARPLTDAAIRTWRDQPRNVDQMVVHYMQPHVPFVSNPELGEYGDAGDFGDGFDTLWGQAGETIPRADVWRAYRENLRYVLDDVQLLLDNIDAGTVAITADHGNAFGEFGQWGHPWDSLLPCIRRVPWVETTAQGSGGYKPDKRTVSDSEADVTPNDRLEALGYR